jgi:hypothetical protein
MTNGKSEGDKGERMVRRDDVLKKLDDREFYQSRLESSKEGGNGKEIED